MADIIEKQELPVTITKIKIGKKDLTKSLLNQAPIDLFVSHGIGYYGLPVNASIVERNIILELDKERDYKINGTLIGAINFPEKEINELKGEVFKSALNVIAYDKNGQSFEVNNFKGKLYYIIWYDKQNKLKRSVIDQWTLSQLNITLEHIYI